MVTSFRVRVFPEYEFVVEGCDESVCRDLIREAIKRPPSTIDLLGEPPSKLIGEMRGNSFVARPLSGAFTRSVPLIAGTIESAASSKSIVRVKVASSQIGWIVALIAPSAIVAGLGANVGQSFNVLYAVGLTAAAIGVAFAIHVGHGARVQRIFERLLTAESTRSNSV